jgi:hypothetical protein
MGLRKVSSPLPCSGGAAYRRERFLDKNVAIPFPPAPWKGVSEAALDILNQGSSEGSLNNKIKQLIQKLGEAIHESVSESESIAGVVRNIREQGFDVLLMLEATIGLNEVEKSTEEEAEESAVGPFTHNDLNFLKSLRISLPDEDDEQLDIERRDPNRPEEE